MLSTAHLHRATALPFTLALAVALLAGSSATHADSPPGAHKGFEATSKNGRFVGVVAPAPGAKVLPAPFGASEWRLTVYELVGPEGKDGKEGKEGKEAPERKELWHAKFSHSGHEFLVLTDDGLGASHILTFFSEAWVGSIYREGKAIPLYGEWFTFDRTAMKKTASHELWLEGPRGFDEEGNYFLTTIDGKRHVVDTKTGKVREPDGR